MWLLILLLILALIFFGFGFGAHVLWWLFVIVAAIVLLGFLVRPGSGSRWYYW